MTVSPRLTRAALTFLLFGTIAALLPSLDTTAMAENGCFTDTAGGIGRYAVAPSSSNISDTYTLTSPATTYNYFYQSPTSSSYSPVTTGFNTTLTVGSGKVNIDGVTYSANSVVTNNNSSFKLAKTPILKLGVITGYENGSVSIRSTYTDTISQTSYVATAVVSNP